MDTRIVGGRVLLGDGTLERCALGIDDGFVDGVDGDGIAALTIDATDHLVLPGLVDIHGDAFERQIMPRPGVAFDLDIALIDTDRQLLANGITTAYHAATNSWEPGLRGGSALGAFLATLARIRPRLDADHRVHLRHETFNLDAEDRVLAWLAEGAIDLLAFNDHVPDLVSKIDRPTALADVAARSGLSTDSYAALLRAVHARANEVPDSIIRLAGVAREAGLPMLAHDEDHPCEREWYAALGCGISEFPKNRETAERARALDGAVVMGAPNAVRGRSHQGSVDAAGLVGAGLCDVLASDYFYPALLNAPFRLHRRGVCAFDAAWRLVSANPARAARLPDRGHLAPGYRADVVIVDDTDDSAPRVIATLVAGRIAFMTGAVRLEATKPHSRQRGSGRWQVPVA